MIFINSFSFGKLFLVSGYKTYMQTLWNLRTIRTIRSIQSIRIKSINRTKRLRYHMYNANKDYINQLFLNFKLFVITELK